MHVMKVDPRALNENPDRSRQTKSTPQADLLLLATIKAVGIVQPPVIFAQTDGGNGYVIDSGHRRVRQAIKAGLEEIEVIVVEASNDNGAMRSIVENTARDPLNPVDLWRAIERLVALSWTEEAIAIALSLTVRRVRQLRLMANVLPAMLDHMAKGDMPNEQQLRTIASASLDEQKEVWKANKPSKSDPRANWWGIANALSKTRMFAKDASFDDELARAYGIEWEEDLFGPADEDGRYTTNVEAYLGAQQEWITNNLPKRGIIAETGDYGDVKLPKKAERVYGKPTKSDHTAMYIDRQGKVQSVVYRMPEEKKTAKGDGGDTGVVPTARPDVTRKGLDMIGDLRTDALHEALARAPIEDDTLMALLVLAFAGSNVSVTSGASGASPYGSARLGGHAARLFNAEGAFVFDMDTLRIAVRSLLIDVLSCRSGRSKSGIVALVAGDAVGADGFLANMGTEEFLSCLSRPALEASCKDTPVLPRQKVKDTRSALVEHYAEGRFVHSAALFEPNAIKLAKWLKDNEPVADEQDLDEETPFESDDEAGSDELEVSFREAAE
ncbi:ParB/RepB/Spo0J family partition protein [Xanthobacter sp. ZOL 2024]